ncbi:MAG: phage tail tube protein [Pseudolabrys sp.]
MADLLESTAERLVVKVYSSAIIDPTVEAVPASDPATTGGQVLRYVSHSFSLAKDAYTPAEMRTDKQTPMEKHGTRRVPGTINGLLSCSTYKDLFAACLGGTWTSSLITASQTDFTSVSADNTTSKFTFGGGNPVTKGLRAGTMLQFANLSDVDNNGKTFTIVGFGGSNNRQMTVYPAPDTMTADSAFTMTAVGNSLIMPSSNHVKRKYAVEVSNSDGDISRLFTEGRFSGFDFSIAPNASATINFSGLWRNRKVYSGVTAPFFTAPTAETTTDIISSMDGLLVLNSSIVGVATGLSVKFNRAPTAPAQLHRQGLTPGILLANAVVTGDFTVFLQDTTFLDLFDDPTTLQATEFGLLCYLPASAAIAPDAMTMFLPRIKINSNAESIVDGAKAIQCGYAAGRYLGTTASTGIESTTIQLCDTTVS